MCDSQCEGVCTASYLGVLVNQSKYYVFFNAVCAFPEQKNLNNHRIDCRIVMKSQHEEDTHAFFITPLLLFLLYNFTCRRETDSNHSISAILSLLCRACLCVCLCVCMCVCVYTCTFARCVCV